MSLHYDGAVRDTCVPANLQTWEGVLEGVVEEHYDLSVSTNRTELQQMLSAAIAALPERQQTALKYHYGLEGHPLSQEEVSFLSLLAILLACRYSDSVLPG